MAETEGVMGVGPTILVASSMGEEPRIEAEVFAEVGANLVSVPHLGTAEALAVVPEAAAVMVTTQPVGAELLGMLGKVRIVTRVGTGVDAIDAEAAAARGVWVTNVPDYSIDEVSSHALALLMALQRNLRGHVAAARAGDWKYQSVSPIRRLSELTLGVLGYGRIGGAMGRKGAGVGMRVIAHDPYIPAERIREGGAEPVDFDTLLRESDYLSLHVPLTTETRGLIDAEALAKMKPTAYVVNTARGEVIDVPALVAAVRSGGLAGAGIDVLPTEPPDPDDPVLHEPRILVTPHVAWASEQAKVDVRRRGAEDVLRVLRGERPRYPVNEPVGVVAGG